MTPFLVLLSLIIAAGGLVTASQVTLGPTLMGLAAVLAVLARVAQAGDHHAARRPKA